MVRAANGSGPRGTMNFLADVALGQAGSIRWSLETLTGRLG